MRTRHHNSSYDCEYYANYNKSMGKEEKEN